MPWRPPPIWIVGDETTWPICNDQGEGGAASCDNLAEVIVRVFDSRLFACRQHAEHGKELDALAIQYEFRSTRLRAP